MAGANYAIRLVREEAQWSWELIDQAGRTAATGAADDQDAAMASAWRLVTTLDQDDLRFPEIVVGEARSV